MNKYILEEWQTSWINSIGNKLLDIEPPIGEHQSVVQNIRKEKVVGIGLATDACLTADPGVAS